ncbi:KLTH0D09922p [Lachancea thermotolerans CBS 6340]|uniref:Ribonucleoside-diphosphate reductase n=1 Tax=Lachancea thermotolerans (strain ATCC 56472 / CBS 6340 / NRRL Y-8284) TaxID=559295 RepID=C5DEU8_LACTC|nr:KLTH0D09922p [Lachancea thermotolerans CBS 6340]CAR22703.1 KLTH0D09922p [Lachancea thermotolerans CBS 6340]
MTVKTVVSDRNGEANKLTSQALAQSLKQLAGGLQIEDADFDAVSRRILDAVPPSATHSSVVQFGGEVLAAMSTTHPDFANLAARWEISELHKKLQGLSFTENLALLQKLRSSSKAPTVKRHKTSTSHNDKNLISAAFYEMALRYQTTLDAAIQPDRDFDFSYFGWKTLSKSYLIKRKNEETHETPQFLFMRVALAIHGPRGDIDAVLETYDLMSRKFFIHASPTLFNAGTVNQYLSSCFLVAMIEDSIDGIYRTLHKTAMISKASGGVGVHVSNVRGTGAYISGSNGTSNGLVPMLRVFNNTARYVDQGGNKRPGAFCIYLEPWHSDVLDFLQLRKNQGKEELRARDLFLALWIPDLFMERVEQNGSWCLFSPDEAPGLQECFGEEFKKLYETYEKTLAPAKKMPAQKLWSEILQSQVETGGPFMLYKDSCNNKSNQKNLGTIKSSNLCCEIVQYSSPSETAVCNLASVALPSFVKLQREQAIFDFESLHKIVKVLTKNLDSVIDICDYPVEDAKFSNEKNRPIAIGVQGLADALMILRIPFHSESARVLNKQIFETIYHAAVETSIERSKKLGPYPSFDNSPVSRGEFQFDLWGLNDDNYEFLFSDWKEMREKVKQHGIRNSLLVGPMPTASTSQILGFTESFEPMTSNIYTRRVLSGEFTVINKYMVDDFCRLGIWNEKLKNRIIEQNGSIQGIEGIPSNLKELYRTVWEIPQRVMIDLSADRGPFIDQSQSLNLFLREPTMGKLTSMHFYGWKKGLKTGMYYLRTQAASGAIKFTINQENTLRGAVSIRKGLEVKQLSVFGHYPSSCKPHLHIKVAKDKRHEMSNSSDTSDKFRGDDDHFGIHNSQQLACSNDRTDANCESCSG